MGKIKKNSIKELEKVNKKIRRHARMDRMASPQTSDENLSVAAFYSVLHELRLGVLENVKYLFEIGLRLLAKNEINSFNLTLKYIHDIYLKYLTLRTPCFIRTPASLFGGYICEDEGFTEKIFEYLKSAGERIVKEKRRENVGYLLKLYENFLSALSDIKYADGMPGEGNPLLKLACAYYISYIDELLASKDRDWMFDAANSLSRASEITLSKTNTPQVYDQINKKVDELMVLCIAEKHDAFLNKLVDIYFDQIKISWNKIQHSNIFWEDSFNGLYRGITLMYASSKLKNTSQLPVGQMFIRFHTWQDRTTNDILNLKDKKEQNKSLLNFISLLKKWSNFLLDFAKGLGLNSEIGLSIIQSVEDNLIIIYKLRGQLERISIVEDVYKIQFDILSFYFQETDKDLNSHILSFDKVLEILLEDICRNLTHKIFDAGRSINLYTRLVERHFAKAASGFGCNHPRIIEKLVHLGLVMNKYGKLQEEEKILSKIDELNNQYIEFHRKRNQKPEAFDQFMEQCKFQLCDEIIELGRNLSYHPHSLGDLEKILIKAKVTKKEWDSFVTKIKCCKDCNLVDIEDDTFWREGFDL